MESNNSHDIKNQNFSTSFRGYDKNQVDNYLKILSKEFEILEIKVSDLNKNISELKLESEKFKSVENSLITTLKTAEDTGKNIIVVKLTL